jgi:DNA recombination protein RmuC
MAVLLLIVGIAVGAAAAWLALRAHAGELRAALRRTEDEREAKLTRVVELERECAGLEAAVEHERRAAAEKLAGRDELANAFKALSADALRNNNSSFLELARTQLEQHQQKAAGDLEQRQRAVEHLVAPIRESLDKVDGKIQALERARTEAYGSLTAQVKALADGQRELRAETSTLVTALRSPVVRGRWGEMQLRRVVETAGMLRHCDFAEQTTLTTDGRLTRPDLIVHLAGGKNVVVDAKVPLQAYLEALDARDEATRSARLADHARQLKDHIRNLSG